LSNELTAVHTAANAKLWKSGLRLFIYLLWDALFIKNSLTDSTVTSGCGHFQR